MTFRYNPPTLWEVFEELMLDIYKLEWGDVSSQRNGRSGQEQWGVDVFSSKPELNEGIQCKKKDQILADSTLTVDEVNIEVKKALDFKPKLKRFLIAYTGSRDAKLQQKARLITEEHGAKGLFSVHILSWEDIEGLIKKHGKTIHPKYYKDFMIESDFNVNSSGKSSDIQILEQLLDKIDKEKIISISNDITGNGANSTRFGTTIKNLKTFHNFYLWFDENKCGRQNFGNREIFNAYDAFYNAYKELYTYSTYRYKPVPDLPRNQGELHLGYNVNPRFNVPSPDPALYHELVWEAERLGKNFDKTLDALEIIYKEL
ncbi:hypothetical protein ACTFR4_22210 [Bacillus cereus group sp. MYBK181-1]|uniref:hypothetical protein n=1 Tax=unclassified Bacillus cereus group TaxID=2750818 RepID=UPI003F79F65A